MPMTEPTPWDTLISSIGQLVTGFVSWLGTVLDFIGEQPLLMIFVLMAVLGIVLAKLKKWLPGI